MDRRFNWTALSMTFAAAFTCGTLANAQCDSGGCDAGGYNIAQAPVANAPAIADSGNYVTAPSGCASGGCSLGRGRLAGGAGCNGCSFGYPGGNCSGGSCGVGAGAGGALVGRGHHEGPFRQHAQHLMEIHRRDFARNQAWPKPFNCADRQLYFATWEPMLESGYRWNCLFTANHFEKDTNILNEAGLSKLRAIYRNNPMAQKVALVQVEGNQSVVDARLENLRSTVEKWYPNSFTEIAMSNEFPSGFRGNRAENISRMAGDQTPPPVIPVASGTGSTSDVGVGG